MKIVSRSDAKTDLGIKNPKLMVMEEDLADFQYTSPDKYISMESGVKLL